MTEALELSAGVSDGDLASTAAEGDRQAFAEIYDRYSDRLYDFCVGLIGDRDAAADCVQDTFCVAATDLAGLREPDKLRPWLYSIARNHAMRRLRHRYREEVSDELPDMVSHDASPETLAGQSELARLVAEAAGGLSDRDRELLDLSYRHGLDGPELAEALGVTLTSANTMMFRLRQTVERCLGALLVARGADGRADACPALAAILKGWDGQFSVLMRKRMARHIDSCDTCERDQRRHVNPVALLGGSAVFIPAPEWLRRQTLDRVQLTCASSGLTDAAGPAPAAGLPGAAGPSAGSRQASKRRMALVVGVPLVCAGLAITWFARPEDPVTRVVDTGVDSRDRPLPVLPAAVKSSPAPARPQPITSAGATRAPMPSRPAETTAPGAATPSQAPDDTGGAAPAIPLPIPGPTAAPAPARVDSAVVPIADSKATVSQPDAGTAPIPNPREATTDAQGGTPPVTNPTGPTTGTTGGGSVTNPNLTLNLNPNVISSSSFPQTNTATVTNPNATSPNLQTPNLQTPNLQIGTTPSLNTNLGPAPKPGTNTNSTATNPTSK